MLSDIFSIIDRVFDKVPDGLIGGLVNGLKAGVSKVGEIILEIGKTIITTICDFLGIHSPSTKAIEISKRNRWSCRRDKSGFEVVSDVMSCISVD